MSLVFEEEPHTWEEVKCSSDAACWEASYCDELKSLKEMGVYKLIPHSDVPMGTKVHKGHPVFHLKHDKHGLTVW